MGCGPSKETAKKKNNITEIKCSTCLVFGMPECGQSIFVKTMERYFGNLGNFDQTFSFVIVPPQRDRRAEWINQYSQPRVIVSFFFADISSQTAILLSIKTLNWLTLQLVDQNPPFVVGYSKNQKDDGTFTFLKSNLSSIYESSKFLETDQDNIQRFIDYINKCHDSYNKTHTEK